MFPIFWRKQRLKNLGWRRIWPTLCSKSSTQTKVWKWHHCLTKNPQSSILVQVMVVDLMVQQSSSNSITKKPTLLLRMKLLHCSRKSRNNTKKGETLPNGWLKTTIDRVCNMRGLPPGTKIPLSTIWSHTKAIVLTEHGWSTTMSQVEPHLVTLILAKAQASRCMGPSKCLALANDLIKDTPVEKEIAEIKNKGNK